MTCCSQIFSFLKSRSVSHSDSLSVISSLFLLFSHIPITDLSQIFILTLYSPELQICSAPFLYASIFIKLSLISHRSSTDLHSANFNPSGHKLCQLHFLQDLLVTLADFPQIFKIFTLTFSIPLSTFLVSSIFYRIFLESSQIFHRSSRYLQSILLVTNFYQSHFCGIISEFSQIFHRSFIDLSQIPHRSLSGKSLP